ncbi:MAG TPA: ATP-binding cassette domain-containing protein [Phycisphaerales bacterium]|nr:ATP-binding cassette domain-containing protein [Phycisphaerales bacterium]
MSVVEAKNAVFGYQGRAIVRVECLQVHAGQCLGVFGPNGSGKTTLVRGLSGLIPPMAGSVQRSGTLRMGYVQQHRSMDLQWPMTALDAASIAVSSRRPFGWMSSHARRGIVEAMVTLEVSDLSERHFASLSGGQQQRVLLAGALAAQPELLILDEPTEGLDVRSRRILLRALSEAEKNGLATIMISHAIDDLASLSDEVVWFHEGEHEGEPSRVEVMAVDSLVERVLKLRQTA